MNDNEEILDSGEIYKESEPLELPIEKEEPLDWSKVSPNVNSGGRWWKTYQVVSWNKEVLRFVPSNFVYFVGLVCLCIGLSFSVFVVLLIQEIYLTHSWGLLFPLLVMVVSMMIVFAFGAMHVFTFPKAVFHKRKGLYKKKKEPFSKLGPNTPINVLEEGETSIKLKDITAIQLLKESVVDKNESTFFSYEINLVLKNGNRINVIDHGNKKAVIKQARRLAEFLEVELYAAKDISVQEEGK